MNRLETPGWCWMLKQLKPAVFNRENLKLINQSMTAPKTKATRFFFLGRQKDVDW